MRRTIDAHRDSLVTGLFEDDGTLRDRAKIPNTRKARTELVAATPPGTRVVLETGTYGMPLARAFQDAGFQVVLAEVREMRRRAGREEKNDWNDVRELEKQDRLGVIKEAYLPAPREDDLRALVRHRRSLSQKQTEAKNQVHAVLGRSGLQEPKGRGALFSRAGLRWLQRAELPAAERLVVEDLLDEVGHYEGKIRLMDEHLASLAVQREDVRRLMTMRGVGPFIASVVVAELGDVQRFASKKQVAKFAGLVPREYQSGNTRYLGQITKQGSATLRWALVQAATSVIKFPGKLQGFYRRVERTRGAKRAKVAVARKIVTILWTMLMRGEDYAEKEDALAVRKLGRMRGVGAFEAGCGRVGCGGAVAAHR